MYILLRLLSVRTVLQDCQYSFPVKWLDEEGPYAVPDRIAKKEELKIVGQRIFEFSCMTQCATGLHPSTDLKDHLLWEWRDVAIGRFD